MNTELYQIPGHGVVRHGVNSVSFPSQWEPPFAGAGLSHDLSRVNIPSPHVVGHEFHAPHTPQIPLTMVNKNICVVHKNRYTTISGRIVVFNIQMRG
jgi:hypothetical protein